MIDNPLNRLSVRVRGEDHHCAILTEADVKLIRECWQERDKAIKMMKATECFSVRSLADKFGTTRTNIEKIVNGYTWKHV